MSFATFAQTTEQKPFIVLACEPKQASDESYNLDVVIDGSTIKLLIRISAFDQDRTEYFEMEAVSRRSSDTTILRATSAPALMLVVEKKGRLNLAGEPSFNGVFRGGGEYGVYRVVCVKKEAPKAPAPAPTPAPAPDVTPTPAPSPEPEPETPPSAEEAP